MKIHNLEILPMCDFIQYFDHHFSLCGPREKKNNIRFVTDYPRKYIKFWLINLIENQA